MAVKVLVVDDEESIREALREFLLGEGGYDVLLAEDGYKALEYFKGQAIDLVFMDVKMPGMDGIEVFRQMRLLRPEVRVVLITGLPDEETFDRALAVSEDVVEGFIPKPFKPADLRKCLKTVVAGDRHASFRLTPTQLDALGRFASAATETASKALGEIVQKATVVSLQSISAVPLSQISKPLEEPGAASAAILAGFSGELSGKVLLMLPWNDALALSDLAQKLPPGASRDFDAEGRILLKALGTIIAHTYIRTIADRTGIEVELERAELLFGHRSALIRSIAGEMSGPAGKEADYLFAIETQMRIIEPPVNCWFSMIPTVSSMKTLLRALGAFG
ncbi:MAG: response regulator [Elusimicrobiota bacterium]|nr:response regulator [Elusimicrobiota bacterium]